MKIVFLDSGSVNPGDLSWRPIEELGEFVHYEDTPAELMRARLEGAGGKSYAEVYWNCGYRI